MFISSFDQTTQYDQNKWAITIIRPEFKDEHAELIIEGAEEVSGQVSSFLKYAHFTTDNKLALKAGVVKGKKIAATSLKWVLKSRTWLIEKEKVQAVWDKIEKQKNDPENHPVLYARDGQQSIFVEKQAQFLKTKHPLLKELKRLNPELFNKMYNFLKLLINPSSKIATSPNLTSTEKKEKFKRDLESHLTIARFTNSKDLMCFLTEKDHHRWTLSQLENTLSQMTDRKEIDKIDYRDPQVQANYQKWYQGSKKIWIHCCTVQTYAIAAQIFWLMRNRLMVKETAVEQHNCYTWIKVMASEMGINLQDCPFEFISSVPTLCILANK